MLQGIQQANDHILIGRLFENLIGGAEIALTLGGSKPSGASQQSGFVGNAAVAWQRPHDSRRGHVRAAESHLLLLAKKPTR